MIKHLHGNTMQVFLIGGRMTVTFGEKKGKKTGIYIDGELKGALYPKDILEYDLADEENISEDTYDRLMRDTLIPRAKRYVMNMLVKSDKTETELKRKLKESGYGEEVSEEAIEYVRSFHYIDELRTAESFIRTKMDYSSEKEIRYKLSEKGIDDETIDLAYEQIAESMDPDGSMGLAMNFELKAAENYIRKKLGAKLEAYTDEECDEELPYEERQKLMASAFRKGFRQDSIKAALKGIMG